MRDFNKLWIQFVTFGIAMSQIPFLIWIELNRKKK